MKELQIHQWGTWANNSSDARTNLWVDPAGTDNSTNVTLAGSLDYLTISGQEITRNAIDLTTDVTGTLPVANGGTGATSLSSSKIVTSDPTGVTGADQITNVMSLTTAEYGAITPDSATLYIITDA